MAETFLVAVKGSVFEKTDFDDDDFDDGSLEFDSQADAEAWIERQNEGRYGTSFVLHSAHPADRSDADAYLIVDDVPMWTVDE